MFAGGPNKNPFFEEKLRKLMDIGVNECQATVALSSCDWDMEKSTNFLFS